MKVIKIDLPKTIEDLELHIFADEHIGDANCDMNALQKRIDYVRDNDNAYCILNGDILDFASRTSIGDIEARNLNIMEQMEKVIELFSPIKKKIICITNGNHEARGYKKDGFDVSSVIANAFGLSDYYTPTSAFIFLRFGLQKDDHGDKRGLRRQYTIYVTHGTVGGRKEGAKAIRLADLASICDADIYIHSHTHMPLIMKQGYLRPNIVNRTVTAVDKLFVNTASNLDYGGYGDAQGYKPTSKNYPVIYLKASEFYMKANL